jgi:uncharacterized Fe-S center protein
MSEVLFSSIKIKSIEADQTLPAKFKRMINEIGLGNIVKGKRVCLKMHLGGGIGYTTIHPLFIRILVNAVKEGGAKKVIVTDGYLHDPELRGYTKKSVGTNLTPLFGKRKKTTTIPIGFKKLDEAQYSNIIMDYDVLLVVSHVKGHGAAGFGAAGKNIAMGCVPRVTRGKIHSLFGGIEWDESKCVHCNKCIDECPNSANKFNDKNKYEIFYHNCTFCQHCVLACPEGSLTTTEDNFDDFQRGLALVTAKVMDKYGPKNILFFNFLMDITVFCDCWGISTAALVPDIGILASKDLVAIDQASLDMIKTENLNRDGLPTGRELGKGNHLFEKIHGKNPYVMSEILAEMKKGTKKYKIIEVE